MGEKISDNFDFLRLVLVLANILCLPNGSKELTYITTVDHRAWGLHQ